MPDNTELTAHYFAFPNKLYSGWYRAAPYTGAYPYINLKGCTQLRLRFLVDDSDYNRANILKLFSGNAILANRPQLIVTYFIPQGVEI